MSDAEFRLKVLINKEKTIVLFAEVGSDFADVLLSFLTLPLGGIVRALNNHYGANAPTLGSLTTLYKGVSDLDKSLFSSEGAKQMLLNPRSWFNDYYRKLKLSVSESQPTMYFICQRSCNEYDDMGIHYKIDGCSCLTIDNVGIYYGTARCSSGRVISSKINFPEYSDFAKRSGVHSSNTASFIICDDMRIVPNVMRSFMESRSILGIIDTTDAEMSNVTLGINEIMDLLKGMFMSTTPLTDVILRNNQRENSIFEPVKIMKASNDSLSNKIILKVIVQKSTNKFLFAQAEENFVSFLYSLLTIPLGGVESLLDMNTCLKSIDNFYTSLTSCSLGKYLKTEDMESMLLNPKLPYGYLGQDHILPLSEDVVPLVYFNPKTSSTVANFSPRRQGPASVAVSSMKSPKGDLYYVKGPGMYMVTDDLTVTPLCMSSSMFHLSSLNVSVSDVAELTFHIGQEEALSILKASLTSTCALTNGLLMKKPVKQEQ